MIFVFLINIGVNYMGKSSQPSRIMVYPAIIHEITLKIRVGLSKRPLNEWSTWMYAPSIRPIPCKFPPSDKQRLVSLSLIFKTFTYRGNTFQRKLSKRTLARK